MPPDEETDTIRREPYDEPPLEDEIPGIVVHRGLPLAPIGAEERGIRQFISPEVMDEIIVETGWGLRDEIALYVEIAKNEVLPPKVRISAAKAIHDLAVKALILRGDIVSIREVRKSDDGTHTVEGMSSVVRRIQQQTTKELTDGRSADDAAGSLEGDDLPADAEGFYHQKPEAEADHQGLAEASVEVPSEADQGADRAEAEADPDPGTVPAAPVVPQGDETGDQPRHGPSDGPAGPPSRDLVAK